jgi:hypothetical protein
LNIKEKYSNLISQVASDNLGNFAALASPTLSKQETVTGLFEMIKIEKNNNFLNVFLISIGVIKFIPRLTYMFFRLIFISAFNKPQTLSKNSIIFKTWLVPRSFINGNIVDDYFRKLILELETNFNVIVSFTSYDIELVKKFKINNTKQNYIQSYGLLSFFDILKLFTEYIFKGHLDIKLRYYLNKVDVTNKIKLSLLLDYLELRSFDAYAEKYKTEILIKTEPKAFIYIYENQSWEKVVCSILNKNNIYTIGYQSSGFSPVFLNFFPTLKDSEIMPTPNIILTVGDNFTKYLNGNGNYKIPLKTFAALRFDYIAKMGKYIVEKPNLKIHKKIIYAFSVHLHQYKPIIDDLKEVFINQDITVHLKIHPLYKVHELEKKIKLPTNFKFITNIDIDLLKDSYDFILFNDNSFGIEALLQGVKSYQYDRNGLFIDDRFMYFDLWKTNLILQDLKSLRDSLNEGNYNKSLPIDDIDTYINLMYKPYTKESLFYFQDLLKLNSAA